MVSLPSPLFSPLANSTMRKLAADDGRCYPDRRTTDHERWEERNMRVNSKEVRPETLGGGVFNPEDYQIFSPDDEMVIGVYRDGVDIRHVIVRNFEPGQENPLHVHPENAH